MHYAQGLIEKGCSGRGRQCIKENKVWNKKWIFFLALLACNIAGLIHGELKSSVRFEQMHYLITGGRTQRDVL